MALLKINSIVNKISSSLQENINQARGKNYCLSHKRYYETSWCPDCACGRPW
ncbi:unnamed protein product [Cunninghamella echinulata]